MKRIISLLPSCTEIICALNGAEDLVGRSHWCHFPAQVQTLPACSTLTVDWNAPSAEIDRQIQSRLQQNLPIIEIDRNKIAELRPDLIFAQNPLPDIGAPVIEMTSKRVVDLWNDIQRVAAQLDVADKGEELIAALKNRLVDVITKTCMYRNKPVVACIEWLAPLQSAGWWVPDLIEFAGGQNPFSTPGNPARALDLTTLRDAEILVLMPRGFDIARTRRELAVLEQNRAWKKIKAVKHKKVFIVDSTLFTRLGPRTLDALETLAQFVRPTTFKSGGEGRTWMKMD